MRRHQDLAKLVANNHSLCIFLPANLIVNYGEVNRHSDYAPKSKRSGTTPST